MTLQSWTEPNVESQQHRPSTQALVRWIGLLLMCLLSATALADAGADAEALIARGIELRRQGKDAEALELFKQAAETHSTPRALAQMGLAEQALGRWVEAEEHLKLALEHDNHPWISRNRETLTRSLATIGERLGSVELGCDVAGASVLVNGAPAGTTPLSAPIRTVAGTVVIEIQADGFHPMTRSLQVAAGSLSRESVTLVPMRVTPNAQPAQTTTPPTTHVITCVAGQVVVEGQCCWPGQSWNATQQQCAGAPQCPPTLIASGTTCVAAPTQAQPNMTSEHMVSRTHVASPNAAAPAPTEAADETRKAAEGGEISVHVGYGGFFRRNAGLFLANENSGPRAFNLGGVAQFAAGYRPIPWISFGAHVIASFQDGNEDYWSAQGGEGRLLAFSTGVYVRGHVAAELFAGALDVWIGTGFHPFSRVWIDTKDLPNYQVNALALPIEFGIALFGSSSFGIELKLSTLTWFPLEYCASTGNDLVCGATTQSQTSWDAGLGFTWVL